jgi:hypothetical protein
LNILCRWCAVACRPEPTGSPWALDWIDAEIFIAGNACWKDIVAFGGAIMAFVIGAGFASGQEAMQFFTHFGLWGSRGAGKVIPSTDRFLCSASR